MTVKEFVDKYVPNINKKEFEGICDKVRIDMSGGYDENKVLTSEQVERLLSNSNVNTHIVNARIISKHKSLLSQYDKLINHYNDLLAIDPNDPSNNKVSQEDRVRIEELRDKLTNYRNRYSVFVNSIDNRDLRQDNNSIYRDYNGRGSIVDNNFDSFRIEYDQARLDRKDNKLEDEYKELDDLNNKLKNAKTGIKKNIIKNRINRVEKRISLLRTKKGIIQNRQRRIIDKNAKRVNKRIQARLELEQQDFLREELYAANKKEATNNLNNTVLDLQDSTNDLNALRSSGKFSDRLKSVGKYVEVQKLKSSQAKIERRLKSLERKNGNAELASQVQHIIQDSLSR